MSSKNIETELQKLRYKVRLLKESEKFKTESFEIAQRFLNPERNIINGKASIGGKITENKNECETRQFTYDEEAFIVSNCYRKSLELVEKHVREKKKKLKFNNSADVKINSFNENISTNSAAELSNAPSFVNECDFNFYHKSKKCDSNHFTSECEVVNNKERNLSSVTSKHTVYKNWQNDLEVQTNESNMNVETDVVFLKTGTHFWKKKKKDKSSMAKNEINNETLNGSDKVNNSNTRQEIFEHTQQHPEIEQKETVNSNIDTVNVSSTIMAPKHVENNCKQIINNRERFNSTNLVKSNAMLSISDTNDPISLFHNKGDSFSSLQATNKTSENFQHNGKLSPGKLKTSVSLINLSSEDDEPETIVPEWDFTEEPVDFTIPALHIEESCIYFSESKIRLLESKGLVIKLGKWSEDETALLIRNYNNFVHRFGISDPRLLLGIDRRNSNKYENGNARKFLRAKHFYARLGKDINHRTLHFIYKKARNLFHPLRYKKNNGQNDISFLLHLQQKYGNRWEVIAKKFGRSASYCTNLYRGNNKCYETGKWSNEEIENLHYAVKKISKSSCILPQNLKSISWVKVSELVKTRSSNQCWRRWKTSSVAKVVD